MCRLSALFLAVLPLIAFAVPVPVEKLFRGLDASSAVLSPDGRTLAALQTDEKDRQHLIVIDLESGRLDMLRADRSRDIVSFRWIDERRILYQDGTFKQYALGMYVVSIDNLKMQRPVNAYDVATVIGFPKARPGRALVWIRASANDPGEDRRLIELDLNKPVPARSPGYGPSDNVVAVQEPPVRDGVVTSWLADAQGELAACVVRVKQEREIYRFERGDRSWTRLALDWDSHALVKLDPDGRRFWISDHADDVGFRLRRYDPDANRFEEPVHVDPDYDLRSAYLFFSPRSGRLLGLRYEQRRTRNVWFDPAVASAQVAMDAQWPDVDNALLGLADDERRLLFFCNGATTMGFYALFDQEARRIQPLLQRSTAVDGYVLRPTQPIAYRTRDGLRQEGYLTLPESASPDNPVPLVVLLHAGWGTRVTWGYSAQVQFLASRGYAVLQPNYRSSSGYAPGISRGNDYEFRRMHEDVTDAVHATLRSGLVDRGRVGIMGHELGGTLAACGAAFEPELYRCAVAIRGVYDWAAEVRSPQASERLKAALGNPATNPEVFSQISPVLHADKIRASVFVAHGTNDTWYDVAQARAFVAALKTHSVPTESHFSRLDNAGVYQAEARVAIFTKLDRFLREHLRP